MNERRRETVMLILVIGAVILLALDSTRFFFQADLTEDKIFTISPVTRELFKQIPQQVHITYYLSDRLKNLTPVPGRIVDMLQEYSAYSHGKIKVTVVDPSTGQAAEAVHRLGIVPQQIQVIQQNEQRVAEVYSGLVIEYLDRTISIPFVFNPETLEYSLTLTIRRILRNSPEIVGIIVGDPAQRFDNDYSMLGEELGLSFTVRQFSPGEVIPPEVSVLVVLGGTELTREQLLPIDQFIMSGGHAIFAVKGLRVETAKRLDAVVVGPSPLLDMLASYGVRVGREMVLDRSARDYRLPQFVFGTIKWMVLGKYPEWVSILPQDVSASNPITVRFPGLDLLWPSDLQFIGSPGISAEPLVKSTKDAWLMKPPFTTDPFKIVGLDGSSYPTKGQYTLADALSGRFRSWFVHNQTAGNKTDVPYGKLLVESPTTRMIVIGDSDFASNLMRFSDSSYNALFLENAVEWLSSDSDLLSIKTRNFHDLRLTRIQNQSEKQRLMVLSEAVNVALIPLIVLVVGLVRGYLRRERVIVAREERRKSRIGRFNR